MYTVNKSDSVRLCLFLLLLPHHRPHHFLLLFHINFGVVIEMSPSFSSAARDRASSKYRHEQGLGSGGRGGGYRERFQPGYHRSRCRSLCQGHLP